MGKDAKDVRQVKDQGHGVTNQGIRRSALQCQWAGRCGAKNIIDVKNMSRHKLRHKSGDTLSRTYLARVPTGPKRK